jgi:chitin synthase
MDNNQSPFYPPPPLPFYQNPHLMGANSSPHILVSPPPHHNNTFPPPTNNSTYYLAPPLQQQQPPVVHQARRYRTIKRLVQIPQGKLVLDCPVPVQYLDKVPLREGREFEKMRYTAITCDPSEFVQKKYTLRQDIMKRETEIVICITMYNVCFFILFFQFWRIRVLTT